MAWAQLVRLPNVFTVLADVGAAYLLMAQAPTPVGRFVLILLAGVALYWAGMVLNDVFDADVDAQERSARPIPAGQISLGQAKFGGWGLLGLGIVFAAIAGYSPAENQTGTWWPAVVAIALAIMIVLYDGPLKKTFLAPTAMGSCRVLSFLLGASPLVATTEFFPTYVLSFAVGMGVYIVGITTMARREATGGISINLKIGWAVLVAGIVIVALSPRFVDGDVVWKMNPDVQFPILVGLIAFPAVMRGLYAAIGPSPETIKSAIKTGIMTIIPLAASIAVLGAGRNCGLAVFALMIPSILLSTRLRVT